MTKCIMSSSGTHSRTSTGSNIGVAPSTVTYRVAISQAYLLANGSANESTQHFCVSSLSAKSDRLLAREDLTEAEEGSVSLTLGPRLLG